MHLNSRVQNMAYTIADSPLLGEEGVALSSMMKSPCLRYRGDFFAMMFEREDALIIKVSPERVAELIATGLGLEFNFTKKTFKEWVMIPLEHLEQYDALIREAMEYVRSKCVN